jgi:hypothetical protein
MARVSTLDPWKWVLKHYTLCQKHWAHVCHVPLLSRHLSTAKRVRHTDGYRRGLIQWDRSWLHKKNLEIIGKPHISARHTRILMAFINDLYQEKSEQRSDQENSDQCSLSVSQWQRWLDPTGKLEPLHQKLVRLRKDEFDEMLCELDSSGYARACEQSLSWFSFRKRRRYFWT